MGGYITVVWVNDPCKLEKAYGTTGYGCRNVIIT